MTEISTTRILSYIFLLLLTITSRNAQAVSICDGVKTLNTAEGEVVSPDYPNEYGAKLNCTLLIDGGPYSRITIIFVDMSIEEYEDVPGSCLSDAIIIDDKRYCGHDDIPPPYVSKGGWVTLRFVSDESNTFAERGFKLRFRVTKVLGEGICPGRHFKRRMSGSLYTPDFPRNYPDRKRCEVSVYVPDNYMMHVWFTSFHLQRSPSCQHDWMVVKDEHGGWKMCGGGTNKIPKPMKLTGRNVKLAFKSNHRKTEKGFHLHYNLTRLTEGDCICTQGLEYIFVDDLKPKMQRAKHAIEFSFKTAQSHGLIMFSKGRLRDYIYIGIRFGRLFYETDLGTGRGRALSLGPRLDDNKWHKILLSRKGKTLGISVDNKLSGTATTRGRFNRLDIPDSVGFFLGAPTSISGLIRNFLGCIRDLRIDGREPIPNAFAMKPDYWAFGRRRFSNCRL